MHKYITTMERSPEVSAYRKTHSEKVAGTREWSQHKTGSHSELCMKPKSNNIRLPSEMIMINKHLKTRLKT